MSRLEPSFHDVAANYPTSVCAAKCPEIISIYDTQDQNATRRYTAPSAWIFGTFLFGRTETTIHTKKKNIMEAWAGIYEGEMIPRL